MKEIGVVGLGIMGSAMARNLLKAGFRVRVFNRSKARAQELAEKGAVVKESPKDLAQECEAVLVIVSDPKAVMDVTEGQGGIFSSAGQGKPLIQLSTIDLETTLNLARRAKECGYRFLDCPVTGSKRQVEAGELILEAGGDKDLLREVENVLLSIGKHIVHAGPIGSGTALKLCMNLIVAQMTTGLCEAVALARALDVSPADIFEVLSNSPALNCVYFSIKKEPLLSGSYPPAFSLSNMLKDVRFMNKESAARGLSLPVTQAVQKLMESAAAEGLGQEDLSAMVKVLRRDSGA